MTIVGRVWLFGDHVDTDAIIPARYLHTSDPEALAAHCMEGLRDDFAESVQAGDILVAGENFGCGSSREHAPIAIQASGVACVVARSFARIFYRNAVNIGLPIVISPEAVSMAREGHPWRIDLSAGSIRSESTGGAVEFEPFPPFMTELLRAGGLVAHTRARIASGELPRRSRGTRQ